MGSLILGGWDYQRIVPEKKHLSTHASAPQVPGAADGCIEDCHAKPAGRRRRGKVQSRQGPWPGVAFLAAAQRRCEGKNLQKKEELPSGKLAEFKKNYFASSDPHHGIQFIQSDKLSGISIWHFIWHVF